MAEEGGHPPGSRPSIAAELYQGFKFAVVAGIGLEAGEVYTLEESRITAWLAEKHPEYLDLDRINAPCGV